MRKYAQLRNLAHMTIAIAGTKIPKFTVSDRLRKAREASELTQAELADEIGVSMRSLGRYESGAPVKKSVILLYSMRTGVPAEWIEFGRVSPEKLPDLDSNQEPIDLGSRFVPRTRGKAA